MVWMTTKKLVVTLVAAASLAQSAAGQADWPQWRGPNHDGIATAGPKLLDCWPKEGPKQLWKSELIPGGYNGGCGSVVVARGRAFVFANWHRPRFAPDKAVLTAAAFEELGKGPHALTADQLGKLASLKGKEFPFRFETDQHGADQQIADLLCTALGPECSDYAAKRRVIMAIYDFFDSVYCLDAATGKTLWKKEFPGVPVPRWSPLHWGTSATPAVAGDSVFVQGSQGFHCLSARDGAVKWQIKTRISNSSPLVCTRPRPRDT